MEYQHKNLAAGRWNELSFFEQMANIGSEVERTIKWRSKNSEFSAMAFERALELLDLSLSDARNKKRFREIARVREGLSTIFSVKTIMLRRMNLGKNIFSLLTTRPEFRDKLK